MRAQQMQHREAVLAAAELKRCRQHQNTVIAAAPKLAMPELRAACDCCCAL